MLRYFAVALLIMVPVIGVQAQTTDMTGDPERGKQKAESCAACHGADGNSNNPVWPKIAGQHPNYIVEQLQAFKSGARDNAQMMPMAQNLSQQDMQDLAAYFAAQKMSPGAAKDDASLEKAETLYRAGKSEAGMPACMACHGPRGNGMPYIGYPKISGQHPEYLASTLKAYRSGEREGAQAQVMQAIAAELTDADIQALANYLSGLH